MPYDVSLVKVQDEVLRIDFTKIYDVILKYTGKAINQEKHYKEIDEVWRKLDGTTISESMKSLLSLTTYLFYIEGIYMLSIDVIIYYLIQDCHDIWSEERRIFVDEFEDLNRIPLATKLKFLEKHDYSETSKLCDRKLRNAIAHHEFEIQPDGTIDYYHYGKKNETNNYELRRRINDIYVMFAFINERRAMALRVDT